MPYFNLLLIALLFISCNNSPDPEVGNEAIGDNPTSSEEVPDEVLSAELQHIQCIAGTYTGRADFVKNRIFFLSRTSDYTLEIAHNENNANPEVLIMITNNYNGSVSSICTSITQPEFSSDEDSSVSVLSGSFSHSGRIPLETENYTIGAEDILISYEDDSCSIDSFSLVRSSDRVNSDSIERDSSQNVRSFSELRNICNNLVAVEEEMTENENLTLSELKESVDLQNPTK